MLTIISLISVGRSGNLVNVKLLIVIVGIVVEDMVSDKESGILLKFRDEII